MLNSMTINNILCQSIEDSFAFLAQNLLNSLQPAKKNVLSSKRGKSTPLGNFPFSVCCP